VNSSGVKQEEEGVIFLFSVTSASKFVRKNIYINKKGSFLVILGPCDVVIETCDTFWGGGEVPVVEFKMNDLAIFQNYGTDSGQSKD
jgi:hypothetical protein